MVTLKDAEKRKELDELTACIIESYRPWPGKEPEVIINSHGFIIGSNLEAAPPQELLDKPKIFIDSKGIIKGYEINAIGLYGSHYFDEHFSRLIHPDFKAGIEEIMQKNIRMQRNIRIPVRAAVWNIDKGDYEVARLHFFPAYANNNPGSLVVLDPAQPDS